MTFAILIFALAFSLGLAIQKGSVCAVLAVEELIRSRRASRFIGFLECGMWVGIIIWALGGTPTAPPLSGLMVLSVGAVLYGVGSAINGACAFGAIARLGNGRFEYLMTGAAAAVTLKIVNIYTVAPALTDGDTPEKISTLVPFLVGLIVLMALRWFVRRNASFWAFAKVGVVMALIGGLGATIGHLHQPWPWTDTLSALPDVDALALITLLALILGALAGGIWGGRFSPNWPTLGGLRDRTFGGALMGAGIALVPGGNDALILRGIPNGSLPAVYGYFVLLLAIALVLKLRGGVFPPWRR